MDLDEALTDLVRRDGDRLLRVGYQLTHDQAAAQDLVQEALLRVYAALRRGGREPAGGAVRATGTGNGAKAAKHD